MEVLFSSSLHFSHTAQEAMKYIAVVACILFSFQGSATAQTFDLNVSCPVTKPYAHTVQHEPANDCGCTTCQQSESSHCDYYILQQNQMLKIQFGQSQLERKNMMVEMARQQAETEASIEDLKRSMSKMMASNQSAIRGLAKQSAQRDEKILFEIRSFGRDFDKLAEKLVATNLQSVENSKAMIELMQLSNEKNARFQNQVADQFRSVHKGLKKADSVREQVDANHHQTKEMFLALDQDMEDMRQKMSRMDAGIKKANSVHRQLEHNRQQTKSLFMALDEDLEDFRQKMSGMENGIHKANSAHKQLQENHEKTENMFSALDEDMDDIREKIDHMEKDHSSSSRAIQGKLHSLQNVVKGLNDDNDKKKTDNKKDEKKKADKKAKEQKAKEKKAADKKKAANKKSTNKHSVKKKPQPKNKKHKK